MTKRARRAGAAVPPKKTAPVPVSADSKLLYAQMISPWDEVLKEVSERRTQAINTVALMCAEIDGKAPEEGWKFNVDLLVWQK